MNAAHDTPIKIRQVKYLNNVDEQDHRAIKRIIRPIKGPLSGSPTQAVRTSALQVLLNRSN